MSVFQFTAGSRKVDVPTSIGPVIICGNTCGHNHDSINGPTGCCEEHGPYMYFCNDCHEKWRLANGLGSSN